MKKCILNNLILVIICTCLLACSKTKSLSETAQLSSENRKAYLLSKSSIERLIIMQEGLFTLYTPERDKALRFMGGDSVMLFSQRFGDEAKDGYWLYQKLYMASLPEKPLSVNFMKFNKLSRDSFIAEKFVTAEDYKNADENPEIFLDIDFKKLKPGNCDIIYTKISQLEFQGRTDTCLIQNKGGVEQITSNIYDVTFN